MKSIRWSFEKPVWLAITLIALTAAPAAAQIGPVLRIRVPRESLTDLRARLDQRVEGSDTNVVAADTLSKLVDALKAKACAQALSGVNFGLFLLKRDDAECVFAPGALTPANLTFYSRGGSVFTDLFSTTFFHKVRLAIATTLSETNEDQRDPDDPPSETPEIDDVREAVQRLIAGGGNFLLTANTPVLFGMSETGSFAYTTFITSRIAIETEALGSTVNDAPISYAGAFHGQLRVGSDDGFVQLFGGFKGELIGGRSALAQLTDDGSKGYNYLEISGGFLVGDLFTVTATKIAAGSGELKTAKTQISITTVNRLGSSQ